VRGASRLTDLEQPGKLADELVAAVEKARVFDRDRRLVGEDLHQAHVVVIEAAASPRHDDDETGDAALVVQRHDEHRVRPVAARAKV
jgi:hypothetical protein